MFSFIQLYIIMSVCLVLFGKSCYKQLTQTQNPPKVYTRTYPFHYPKELLILTCYMLHTWFGKLLCKISGDNFEDKIVILVKPKEVPQCRDKKPRLYITHKNCKIYATILIIFCPCTIFLYLLEIDNNFLLLFYGCL